MGYHIKKKLPYKPDQYDYGELGEIKETPTSRIRVNKSKDKELPFGFDAIEENLKLGMTVEDACLLAGVSRAEYYKATEEDLDLKYRMLRAKGRLTMLANANIATGIAEGDRKLSLEYLKLRDRRYSGDAMGFEEVEVTNLPKVQFISVASKGETKDGQKSIEQKSVSNGYANSSESVETPRENGDQILENLNSATTNSDFD